MILVLMRSCWGSRERQRRLPISNSGAEHTRCRLRTCACPRKGRLGSQMGKLRIDKARGP